MKGESKNKKQPWLLMLQFPFICGSSAILCVLQILMMRKFEVGETIWVNLGCRCKWTYYAKEGDLIMDFDDDHQGGKNYRWSEQQKVKQEPILEAML